MKILYFSWLREKVGTGAEDVTPPESVKTLGDLVEWLQTLDAAHASAFENLSRIRFAINQDHVGLDAPVKAGDEIALFPPVTGG